MIRKFKDNFKKTIWFLLFLVTGTSILLALLSFNVDDNTYFKFDTTIKATNNLLGYFGSTLSDLLFKTFGLISYIISFFLLFTALRVVLGKDLRWYSFAFLPLTIIMLCLLTKLASQTFNDIEISSGFLGDGLSLYFNYILLDFKYKIYIVFGMITLFLIFFLLTFNIGSKEIIYGSSKVYSAVVLIAKFLKVNSIFNLTLGPRIFKSAEDSSAKTKLGKNKIIRQKMVISSDYKFPSIDLLERESKTPGIESENKKNAELNTSLLAGVLRDFKISGQITDVKQGPIVTLFELTPAPGTLSSSVIRLSEDIARSMSAKSTRISTIPGKDAIGIEIPNKHRELVFLRELLNDKLFKANKFKLPLALGKDIFGKPVIVDLSAMPHLLVAGTTGSGKSVGINAMLLSLLYYLSPEECRLILIDPKMLELSIYQDIPHLLTEVVTDPKKAISALKWTVKEMENRYQMMTHLEVREIDDYNKKVKRLLETGQVVFKEMQVGYDSETGKPVLEKKALDLAVFPKIVVVVDELADLMITSGKEIEGAIQRLSQMARAAGIHLIVATQRPSVDVITGTIKSNFPTRISYKVVNKINSRTILEEQGAEQLLGQGDLLITMLGENLLRVHGPFVKTEEVQSVVNHLKLQGEPEYLQSVTKDNEEEQNFNLGFNESGDELYDKAVSIVCREKKASTSFIQRHLQIGYNRAARIIEKMESEGIVSPANHVGRREVLVGKDS